MKNNKDKINSGTKYNCLKDFNFWSAFVIGGGIGLINISFAGMIFHPVSIIGLLFLISWETWIIFKKGRKGSFINGFVIATIAVIVVFFPIMKIVKKQQNLEENQDNGIVLDKEEIRENFEGAIFSPNGKRFAYVVEKNNKQTVVLDGRKSEEYNRVSEFIFSPNSKRFAFMALKDYRPIVVLDGIEEGEEYSDIISLKFSSDSKHFMYKVKDYDIKSEAFIVYDQQEEYRMPDFPALSADGKHFAYVIEENDKQFVVLNNRKNKSYEKIYDLTFSPDNKHFAYVAKDNNYFVVLDGQEGGGFSSKFTPKSSYSPSIFDLTFSSNSKFLAYRVDAGGWMTATVKDHNFVLLRNLKSGKEKKYNGGYSFLFSPDSNYFLYKSFIGDSYKKESDCKVLFLNDDNSEFETIKSYSQSMKYSLEWGWRKDFNFRFSDDSRYVIYNKSKFKLNEEN